MKQPAQEAAWQPANFDKSFLLAGFSPLLMVEDQPGSALKRQDASMEYWSVAVDRYSAVELPFQGAE